MYRFIPESFMADRQQFLSTIKPDPELAKMLEASRNVPATEEELRRLIRDAGFVPKQRDTLYTKYFLN